MLSLTRKTEYALVALTHLARQTPSKVSARDISRRFRLPLPALTNILNDLTRQGLISSTRGARGGYWLSTEPGEVSLANLVDAVEGTFKLTACCGPPTAKNSRECQLRDLCPVSSSMREVNRMIRQLLGEITLDHIARGKVTSDTLLPAEKNPQPGALSNSERTGNPQQA